MFAPPNPLYSYCGGDNIALAPRVPRTAGHLTETGSQEALLPRYFCRYAAQIGAQPSSGCLQTSKPDRIDVVVVYKIDRLSRSLMDFAKLVEVFDRKGVTFVSVTQSFNTTTSMGRLTLNVLLSFAQFEREVTGERIRDKFAASKKKGIWMGGNPPLGYDVANRKLVVNPARPRPSALSSSATWSWAASGCCAPTLQSAGLSRSAGRSRPERRAAASPWAEAPSTSS